MDVLDIFRVNGFDHALAKCFVDAFVHGVDLFLPRPFNFGLLYIISKGRTICDVKISEVDGEDE